MRTSLWFVPGLLVLGALGLATVTPIIDGLMPAGWARHAPLVFSGRPVGARAVLSTIATATIGVAGVVFSMTIVSLQLASSQFGPRLLRTFLRDRASQLVLGTFLGTFLYCIIVLPTVDATNNSVFVPHMAVTIAVMLAIASLAMLVYYIDHIAQSIHADAVMHSVAQEMELVIDQIFPESSPSCAEPTQAEEPPVALEGDPCRLCAKRSGYIRFINCDQLLATSCSKDLFVRVRAHPGSFVMLGDCLADVWPADRVTDEARDDMISAFVLGAHRTTLQDLSFAFEQLSEVAMRALSPGINDPTTAMHCIDRIGSGIARLVTRQIPSKWRTDESDVIRIQIDPIELEAILEVTVIAVSRTATVHLQVWRRLVEVLHAAAIRAIRPEDAATLRTCARRLKDQATSELKDAVDRRLIADASIWASSDD